MTKNNTLAGRGLTLEEVRGMTEAADFSAGYAAGRADAAGPDTAVPAGDLISQAVGLLAEWESTPAEGDPMIDVLLGVIGEALGLLRALPAAPEAGEVERPRADRTAYRKARGL